jgi:hypothetical protein
MVLLASAFDQSRFFKAAEFPAERKFRIKSVTVEEVGQDKERKLVAWFTNDARGLVLNKTNLRTLSGAFGDDTAGWPGKIIIAFPTQDEFRGRMVPVIRLRIPTPKGNGQSAAKPADDGLDIPTSLKRAPKAAQTPPDEIADLIDADLNDEINL